MEEDCSKCKCWKKPWKPKPPCYNCCAGRLLRYAKPDQLVKYLHITVTLSEKVYELTSNDKLTTLSDIKPYLTPDEYSIVDSNLQNMDYEGWEWATTLLAIEMGIEEPVAG